MSLQPRCNYKQFPTVCVYRHHNNNLYTVCTKTWLTRFERYLADHHPLVGEEQLQFEEPAGPVVEFDRDVSGLGHDGVRRIRVRHGFGEEVFATHTEIGFGVRENLNEKIIPSRYNVYMYIYYNTQVRHLNTIKYTEI